MSSFIRVADAWLPTIADISLVFGVLAIVRGLWKIIRFVGLCRLFRRWSTAVNARLGLVSPLGVLTDRERRVIEGHTDATDRAGPPMIF